MSEWGNPSFDSSEDIPDANRGGERGELKHLSTRRRRKQVSDSASSGERTRSSPNRAGFGPGGVVGPTQRVRFQVEGLWKGPPQQVTAL